jgi:arginyl-tRNA synthetase
MIEQILNSAVTKAVKALYQLEATPAQIQLQNTRKEFEGDFTVVVFPFTKVSRKSPEATAAEIGEYLQQNVTEVESYNVIKGFLNLSVRKDYWLTFLANSTREPKFGFSKKQDSKPVVVEYSSPNTNKPLHLGHIRNNLLGFSLSRILQAAGKNVVKVNLVNDRGIHICKSMLAWQRWGNGETPESSGLKGDHLVGKYYVVFDKHYKEEISTLVAGGMQADEAAKKAPLILEAQQYLQKWEAGDDEVINLWKKMNGWVYDGFATTYRTLGLEFVKTYYESQT